MSSNITQEITIDITLEPRYCISIYDLYTAVDLEPPLLKDESKIFDFWNSLKEPLRKILLELKRPKFDQPQLLKLDREAIKRKLGFDPMQSPKLSPNKHFNNEEKTIEIYHENPNRLHTPCKSLSPNKEEKILKKSSVNKQTNKKEETYHENLDRLHTPCKSLSPSKEEKILKKSNTNEQIKTKYNKAVYFFTEKDGTAIKNIITAILKNLDPVSVEGRTVDSFVNQLINSNSDLSPYRNNSSIIFYIKDLIENNPKFSFSIDRSKFGIVDPEDPPGIDCSFPKELTPTEEQLEEIWEHHGPSLLKGSNFNAIFNTLINTAQIFKNIDSKYRANVIRFALRRLLYQGKFWYNNES